MNKSIAFVSLAITFCCSELCGFGPDAGSQVRVRCNAEWAQEPTPAEAPTTPSPGVTTSANGTFKIHVLPAPLLAHLHADSEPR